MKFERILTSLPNIGIFLAVVGTQQASGRRLHEPRELSNDVSSNYTLYNHVTDPFYGNPPLASEALGGEAWNYFNSGGTIIPSTELQNLLDQLYNLGILPNSALPGQSIMQGCSDEEIHAGDCSRKLYNAFEHVDVKTMETSTTYPDTTSTKYPDTTSTTYPETTYTTYPETTSTKYPDTTSTTYPGTTYTTYPETTYTTYPETIYTTYPDTTSTKYPETTYTTYPETTTTTYPETTYTTYPETTSTSYPEITYTTYPETTSTTTTPMTTTTTVKKCGPDVTKWLIDEMIKNKDHPVIKTNRDNDWAMWIPGFNIGWHAGFLIDFKNLVKAGAVWDYKATQDFTSANCPKNCPKTVTLCGICFFYDVPGNIHYGWVGRAGRIRAWFLHNRAAAAQDGGVDDPKDTAAIDIGIDLWDNGGGLCPAVRKAKAKLATRDCPTCGDIHPLGGKPKKK